MHKLSSSDSPVSPERDTEVWEKSKEKGDVQNKSCPWGWSLLHPSSPSTGSLRVVSCCWQPRDKRQKLWDSLTPSELVISSNKLENVKKIQMYVSKLVSFSCSCKTCF